MIIDHSYNNFIRELSHNACIHYWFRCWFIYCGYSSGSAVICCRSAYGDSTDSCIGAYIKTQKEAQTLTYQHRYSWVHVHGTVILHSLSVSYSTTQNSAGSNAGRYTDMPLYVTHVHVSSYCVFAHVVVCDVWYKCVV